MGQLTAHSRLMVVLLRATFVPRLDGLTDRVSHFRITAIPILELRAGAESLPRWILGALHTRRRTVSRSCDRSR